MMYQRIPLLLFLCLLTTAGFGQSTAKAVSRYYAFLRSFQSIQYDIQRIDTFPDGSTWDHTGRAVLVRDKESKILGAQFSVARPDLEVAYVFNGNIGFKIDHKAKTVKIESSPYAPSILGGPAGQLIVPELLTLDTSFIRVSSQVRNHQQVVTFYYPDQPKIDQRNRSITLVLDSKSKLPLQVRSAVLKGEAYWITTSILSHVRLNQPGHRREVTDTGFLTQYTVASSSVKPTETTRLVGQKALNFQLVGLDNRPLQLEEFRGKLILLDFWTSSCTPCITSMPKLQALQEAYRANGLIVLGIVMDPQNTRRAEGILQRQGVSYRNIKGDAAVENLYKVTTYPRYVLIDTSFNVIYDDAGYSEQLEHVIRQQVRKP